MQVQHDRRRIEQSFAAVDACRAAALAGLHRLHFEQFAHLSCLRPELNPHVATTRHGRRITLSSVWNSLFKLTTLFVFSNNYGS
ncbi:hypothetical protein D9M70_490520 [compost metagenome]